MIRRAGHGGPVHLGVAQVGEPGVEPPEFAPDLPRGEGAGADEDPHGAADLDIDAGRGFVEDQQAWFMHQRTRNHQPAFHAAGEFPRHAATLFPQSQPAQVLFCTVKRLVALGAGEILLTSMDRDGTRAGFDVELTRAVADSLTIPVIASGGVGVLDHLVEGVRDGHASAVLAASIFHFGEHTIAEAKAHMAAAGVPVRPVN